MTAPVALTGTPTPAECQYAVSDAAGGVASALRAVDCVAAETTGAAFGRLFASGGALVTALTILLTLYIAFFAINLLTGRSSLGVRSLTPRMLTLGLVLTFASSWVAYQAVVWNLAIGAPDWLAGLLTGDSGSATATFATKVDVVFAAIEEASGDSENVSAFSPEGMLWLGAMLFMLGTVGVLVTARIALAVLVALGPIFVVLALFNGTRGMFTGWLKGVVMLALTPLFAVLAGSVMLELSVPILNALTAIPGEIEARSAMAFFMIGAVHIALMIMVLKVAGTMVSGWQVFGLVPDGQERGTSMASAAASAQPQHASAQTRETQAASTAPQSVAAQRTAIAAGVGTAASRAPAIPANDTGGGSQTTRVTNVLSTTSGEGQAKPLSGSAGRTVGLGTRFKPAPPRNTEKLK